MKKIIRLTESDLTRIVKRTIKEMDEDDYTADDAIAEIDSYIQMVGCSEGRSRLLNDLTRMVHDAERELSEEEFDKLLDYVYDLEREIYETCSDEEEEEEESFYESDITRIVKRVLNEQTQNDITLLSDNLLFKSLENWYGDQSWMNVFPSSTGWKENMSRNESDGRDNHPCILGGVDSEAYNPKFLTQDTEIPERCKTYLKDNYTDYLNKFLVKNGFVDGFNVTTQNYAQVKKLYDTLEKNKGWKK